MKTILALAASAALLVSLPSAAAAAGRSHGTAQSGCASPAAARDIERVVKAFFAALAKDDDAELRRITTLDFYAYDIGKRFTGPELSKAIADLHRAGRTIEWNIGPVDTRIDCNLAFAAWENTGASGTRPNLQPRSWLESALLVRRNGRWLIHFLHSTPKDTRP